MTINEKEIHTLDDITENFDITAALASLNDGSLEKFLRESYYEKEAYSISKIKLDDPDCIKKVCDVFGVDYVEQSKDLTTENNERIELIKTFTTESEVLKNYHRVALNQQELAELLGKNETLIYLCHGKFSVPLSKQNVKYIGIDNASIPNPYTLEQYKEAGITIENIGLPSCTSFEVTPKVQAPLVDYFYNKLKSPIPFYSIHLPYNTSDVSKRFKSKYAAEQKLREILKRPYDKATAYFTPESSSCLAKTLANNYSEAVKNHFEPVLEQLRVLYSISGKSENYDKLLKLVKDSKKILTDKFNQEIYDSQDYYRMYKFEYFVDSVDIEKNDFRTQEGLWGVLEAAFNDSIDYTYCELYTSFSEMEKDLNDRAASFYKYAHSEYLDYLYDIKKELEALGNDLPKLEENEDINAYITRVTIS